VSLCVICPTDISESEIFKLGFLNQLCFSLALACLICTFIVIIPETNVWYLNNNGSVSRACRIGLDRCEMFSYLVGKHKEILMHRAGKFNFFFFKLKTLFDILFYAGYEYGFRLFENSTVCSRSRKIHHGFTFPFFFFSSNSSNRFTLAVLYRSGSDCVVIAWVRICCVILDDDDLQMEVVVICERKKKYWWT
jgi:hypothetical protein